MRHQAFPYICRLSGATTLAVWFLAILLGCDPPDRGETAPPIPSDSQSSGWRVDSAEEVVRLPDGRVALCNDTAPSIAACPHAPYLDPEWPVARVLDRYPFFDPDEVARRLWSNAQKREIFERTGDSRIWTPESLPSELAGRDDAAGRIAQMWGREWRRYHTDTEYRERVNRQADSFEAIQRLVASGDFEEIPSCEKQQAVLDQFALCETSRFVSTEWPVSRISNEFEGLDESDVTTMMSVLWSDARDRHDAAQSPSLPSADLEDLSERLERIARNRSMAKRRLRAAGEFDFLDPRRI